MTIHKREPTQNFLGDGPGIVTDFKKLNNPWKNLKWFFELFESFTKYSNLQDRSQLLDVNVPTRGGRLEPPAAWLHDWRIFCFSTDSGYITKPRRWQALACKTPTAFWSRSKLFKDWKSFFFYTISRWEKEFWLKTIPVFGRICILMSDKVFVKSHKLARQNLKWISSYMSIDRIMEMSWKRFCC